jgi:ectoine hydroxylase-related dioxygenase (phytanoyl-CoA dioxygenase family)
LDDEGVVRLRQEVERLFAGEFDGHGSLFNGPLHLPGDPTALRRVINGWWVNDAIRTTVLDPGIGRIASVLMGADGVRLWADQVLVKPGAGSTRASASSNIGWHQDAAYWHINSHRQQMVTAWIALQKTDLANGGMRTLVGSHRWGLVEDSDRFYDADLDGQRREFEKRGFGPWIDEPCVLQPGQVSFHHSLCFHGSGANTTDASRVSIVGHYMPDGAVFTPSGRFQVFLPLMGPNPRAGTPLKDPCFPLVYP